VREKGTTFEEATDLAIDTLKMRVKKFKNKRSDVRTCKPPVALAEADDLEDI
jgi:putative sigma-54 modulation protein